MSKVYTVVALCVPPPKKNAQSITVAVKKIKMEGVCGAETIQVV